MTRDDLRAYTRRELAAMAKTNDITGWHSMRKEELVDALFRVRAASRRRKKNGQAANGTKSRRNGAGRNRPGSGRHRLSPKKSARSPERFGANGGDDAALSDRLVARICDSRWIQVRWSLSAAMLERAAAALGTDWHGAIPVLRLFELNGDDVMSMKTHLRDIEVRGDADCWYLPVERSEGCYRLQIGYRAGERFFCLSRSNLVRLPGRAAATPTRNGWTHHSDAVRDPAGNGAGGPLSNAAAFGSGAKPTALENNCEFPFSVDAELVVHGQTHPSAALSLLGKSVPVARDGSFTLRLPLAEGRQVIPAVVITPDGAEQRTIILAIERNTKELDPQSLDEMLI